MMPLLRFCLVACLCVIASCYQPALPPSPPGGDLPTSLAGSAERAVRDYGRGLASTANTVADKVKSGEIKDHPSLFSAFGDLSEKAHEAAMTPYEDAFTAANPPDKEFDPVAAEKALREIADGFSRASK